MGEVKKVKKMDPESEEWQNAANAIARSFAPTIYPCQTCFHPVAKGYCCTACGSTRPSGNLSEDDIAEQYEYFG